MKRLRQAGLTMAILAPWVIPVASFGADEAEEMGQRAEKKVDYLDRLVRFDKQQMALGNVALKRSQDPRIRELANRLIKDHEANLQTLKTWAEGRAMQISALAEDPGLQQGTGGSGMERAKAAASADSEKHIQKADEQSAKASADLDKLSRDDPEKFSKDFLSKTIDWQKKGVELVKDGRKEFKEDGTLAAVLAKTEPVLEGHIAHAKSLKDLK